MGKAFELPKALTEADWKKHKGLLAKIVDRDTGIGDALRAVETKFAAVDWSAFDAATQLNPKVTTLAEVNALIQAAKTQYGAKVEPLRADLAKLRDLARKTAADWKKNKAIPSSSAKQAELIAGEADELYLKTKDNSAYLVDFVKACEGFKGILAVSVEHMKKGELPTNFDYDWFHQRKPTVGFAEPAKLKVVMTFLHLHYVSLLAGKNPLGSRARINDLRQMIAGLDQTEAQVKLAIAACKSGQHQHTEAALRAYLPMIVTARKKRMEWLKQEVANAKTNPESKKILEEIIIGPGLMRL